MVLLLLLLFKWRKKSKYQSSKVSLFIPHLLTKFDSFSKIFYEKSDKNKNMTNMLSLAWFVIEKTLEKVIVIVFKMIVIYYFS